jgi:two-component system, response regulator FlrC
MSKVLIETTGLSMAAKLADLISRRMLSVNASVGVMDTSEPAKGATLIFSAAFETQMGGPQALIERARKFLPRLVVILSEGASGFSVTPELGGKILRVDLPGGRDDTPQSILVAADLICADLSSMIAADEATVRLTSLAARVARKDVTVFVNGPTGTGKEVLSKFVHNQSARAGKPFVAVNCAAIPENLLEAVLFGHEKGSFTGASAPNKGIFRAADGGTLLLDEISEMPLGLQSKLLRVLQERIVTPLGSQAEIAVDVRVIATSNRNMFEQVQARTFREDLYYRLNVFPLETLALADRPSDIIPLTIALIRRHTADKHTQPWLGVDAVDVLLGHDWPGNVRELENVIQRALVLQSDGRISAQDIIIDRPKFARINADAKQAQAWMMG